MTDLLTAAPRSMLELGPSCPGCGSAVDALRAGHVAIFGGQFLYYCDAKCKVQHLLGLAEHMSDDVATMDPPAVAERMASAKAPPVSGEVSRPAHRVAAPTLSDDADDLPATGTSGTHAVEASGALADPAREDEEPGAPTLAASLESDPAPAVAATVLPPVTMRVPAESSPSREDAIAARDEAHPRTLRSPAPDAAGPASPARPPRETRAPASGAGAAGARREQAARAASIVGVAAGLLVPALTLIGDLGAPARMPLVVVAAVALVAHLGLARRDPADVSPWASALPVGAAAADALAAQIMDAPRALAIAWFAGVAAASALLVEMALERARRETGTARAHIARALDVPVRVVREGGTAETRPLPATIKPGEQVVVEAGEVVGVDGIVVAGEAIVVPWVDAPIELKKAEGDSVVAGARVVSGRLRLTTTWGAEDRAWSKLAQSPHLRIDVVAPRVRFARALVERGAPVAAALVAVAAFANGAAWVEVIAAACAAALAVGARAAVGATALVHARGQLFALEHGVVYKDAGTFDDAGRTDVAVVCSRGTVLTGEPEIVALEPLGPASAPFDVARLLALAAGAETASTHPFAAAILRAARARGERPENVRSATVHAGLGVTALASNGEHLAVGSRALLLQEKVSIAVADARVSELEAQGRSVLLVALGGKLVGLLALQDGLRAGARAAVQRLLDARIEPVLLSGEARETCETIGRALDIEHIRPEVLPADRGAEVRALGEGGHVVAVIGHPATDDGALGAADVSIAMCSAGATPGEWAIALASDDVRDAAFALGVAHATRDRARVALALSLAPGGVALFGLVFGIAGLLVAPIAVAIGSVAALVHARAR
jgi:Cu+-exporting ATPase